MRRPMSLPWLASTTVRRVDRQPAAVRRRSSEVTIEKCGKGVDPDVLAMARRITYVYGPELGIPPGFGIRAECASLAKDRRIGDRADEIVAVVSELEALPKVGATIIRSSHET
jgi:hypothetical protein